MQDSRTRVMQAFAHRAPDRTPLFEMFWRCHPIHCDICGRNIATDEAMAEVIECLKYGQTTPGGHILHASHSVHEDVKVENYYAAVNAYRDFFGLEKLPG